MTPVLVADPCWLCGRDTEDCYVVWALSTGDVVHVCDLCCDRGDRDDDASEEGSF